MDKEIILVPTDFSEPSDAAVQYAISMAKQLGAKIIFLHAIDWAKLEMTALNSAVSDLIEEPAKTFLNSLVQRAKAMGIEAESKQVDGSPFIQIVQMAETIKADLIVMGTHGRTGLSHLVLGSQTEQVVRHAPCPVLTVRRPSHAFVPR